jgi:hypothetical protein
MAPQFDKALRSTEARYLHILDAVVPVFWHLSQMRVFSRNQILSYASL